MFEWISIVVILMLALLLVIVVNANQAQAHDAWANGAKIPDWVKASCCGPADAHHLTPEQVTRDGDYYRVAGYNRPIPVVQAIPSQDGDYWIFYREGGANQCAVEAPGGRCWTEEQSGVYCFFVPMAF